MLTKISKLNLSYSTKSCRHALSPIEKNLAPHLFFCRILRQWRSTAQTLRVLKYLSSYGKKNRFFFLNENIEHYKFGKGVSLSSQGDSVTDDHSFKHGCFPI